MKNKFITTTLVVVTLALMSCATTNRTTFQSTWKNPDGLPLNLNGQNVLAVFMSSNTTTRQHAEDVMAQALTARGVHAVAAYTVLNDSELRDSDAARQKAAELGYTAAVIVRMTGTDTQYTYTPGFRTGGPYRHLWGAGYWRSGWASVWEPGYLTTDKIVRAETLVYSLERDELVWTATSRTFDPGRIDSFVTDLTRDISKEMSKDGLVASL